MKRPVVLVGENPLRLDLTGRPELSLTGSSGQNLARMAGVSWPAYLRRTERRNLFYVPVERWDPEAAALEAELMDIAGRRVILLGRKVATAFGAPTLWPNYEWHSFRDARVATMPHPSGLNRVYNSTAERYAAGNFLREAMYE